MKKGLTCVLALASLHLGVASASQANIDQTFKAAKNLAIAGVPCDYTQNLDEQEGCVVSNVGGANFLLIEPHGAYADGNCGDGQAPGVNGCGLLMVPTPALVDDATDGQTYCAMFSATNFPMSFHLMTGSDLDALRSDAPAVPSWVAPLTVKTPVLCDDCGGLSGSGVSNIQDIWTGFIPSPVPSTAWAYCFTDTSLPSA